MSTNTALDDIKARVEAATPGPWVEFHENGTPGVTEAFHCAPATGAFLIDYGADRDQQGRDATFIAHARTDIPKLLAALEEVEALHRPDAETGKCEECTYAQYSMFSVSYPCPTIKAIEEALR